MLGLVPGLIMTIVVAGFVLYTSLVLWYMLPWENILSPFLHFPFILARSSAPSPPPKKGGDWAVVVVL